MERVALVSEHASPLAALGGVDAGGQNVHVAALARELGRRGIHVDVYTRRDAPGLPAVVTPAPRLRVHHLDAGPPAPVGKDALLPHMGAFAVALAERWTESPPDLVHAHFWMSGLASMQAAGPTGIPVVQTFHALGTVKRRQQGRDDTSPGSRCRHEAELVGTVDGIIATCGDEAAELERMGASAGRVHVIPCGVDTTLFRPDGPRVPRSSWRHRILVVARLVPRKGIAEVIEALVGLGDTELVVVGGPPSERLGADPEALRLGGLADDLGLGRQVRLVGGVSRAQVAAWMRSSDLVVSAPWYEPFGIVPLEAMACGIPVVGTAVGGLLDTVVDGRTGVLVPPRDVGSLQRAIRTLLAQPAERADMGRAAVARARSRYRWDRVAERTLAAYRHCQAERRLLGGVA
jgi:glycosyltransferase involved in cell wall biosynthesis